MFRLIGGLGTLVALMQSPSPHRVAFIAVQPGVTLEVLDFGGSGPALVFLAGFGDTGHIFDGFAPQFTNTYHVIGITRRGFGSSSHPATGYDTRRLVQDITAVLDSLRIKRASFIGHSFAGSELSYLGGVQAERVEKLVYLDASYDFARLFSDSVWAHAFPIPRPPGPASTEIGELRRWFALVMGPRVPDDEIGNLTSSSGGPDSLTAMLQHGAAANTLPGVKVPVLAFWAEPKDAEDQYPYLQSMNATERARLRSSFADQAGVRRSHLQQFREQVRGAHVITVPRARHFLFLTHPRMVVGEIRAFLESPK